METLASFYGSNFCYVDTSFVVYTDAVGSLDFLVSPESAEEFAFGRPDTDAAFLALFCAINGVVIGDPYVTRCGNISPLLYEYSVWIEYLNPIVLSVADEDTACFVTTDVVNYGKLTRTASSFAPREDVFAFFCVLVYTATSIAIGDIE